MTPTPDTGEKRPAAWRRVWNRLALVWRLWRACRRAERDRPLPVWRGLMLAFQVYRLCMQADRDRRAGRPRCGMPLRTGGNGRAPVQTVPCLRPVGHDGEHLILPTTADLEAMRQVEREAKP